MPRSKEEALKECQLGKRGGKKGNQTTESKIRPSEHSYYLKHWVFLLLPYGLPDKKDAGPWPRCPWEGITFSSISEQCFLSSCGGGMRDTPRTATKNWALNAGTGQSSGGRTRANDVQTLCFSRVSQSKIMYASVKQILMTAPWWLIGFSLCVSLLTPHV